MELEGLRGLAAVVVFVFHFLVLFYPMMYYGPDAVIVQHSKLEDNIFGSPLIAFISGTFSVSIFFVLSGFVLSIGFFQTKKVSIVRKLATKRYLRLMLPAFASVIFALVLIKMGASSNADAYAISQSPALPINWVIDPSFFSAVYEGMIGVFFSGASYNYNSVLWTMKYEFIGSFIIFIFAALFGKSRQRWVIYIALIVALHSTWYLGLILGLILADVYVHRIKIFNTMRQWHLYGLLAIGIVAGAYPSATSLSTVYDYINLPWLNHEQNQALYTAVGALFVVIAVINIEKIKTFMSSKVMTTLGSYTYSLYLVHQPLIYTVGTSLFVFLIQHMGYNRSVLLSMTLTVPVVIFMTILFYRYIEQPSVRAASYFEELYSGRRQLHLRPSFTDLRLRLIGGFALLRQKFNRVMSSNSIDDGLE